MMKKYYKIMIASLLLLLSITFVPAKTAVGYNYSHDGRLIYSTDGLSVAADGIFTVISYRWTNEAGDKVESAEFQSTSDLYLFTEKNVEHVIYIVDSGSNISYVFRSE